MIIMNFRIHNDHFNQDHRSASKNIRIMAYNIRGFIGAKPSSQTVDSITTLIEKEHPDVVNLEEFAINIDDQLKIYSSLKNAIKPGYYYYKPYDYTQYDSSGVAIFSKYPIVSKGEVLSPKDPIQTQAIFVDLKKNKGIFRIYCVHLQSTHFNPDDHAYLRKLTHSGKVNLKKIKLVESKLKDAFIKRSYQASAIKKHMDKCPYPYVIAGDFNDTPNSFAVTTIAGNLKNAFVEKGNGLGFTYYGDFPNVQIDYILTSRQFNVLSYRRIIKEYSDHYPIISDLSVSPKL